MKTPLNTVNKTVRTLALAGARKTPRVNPYLFDVRNDDDLRNLLIDAANHGETVRLPVGAYCVSYSPPVQNCYSASGTYVLVSPTGKTRYCYNGFDAHDQTTDWVKWIQRFLGVLPKPKKAAKKTKRYRTDGDYLNRR